MKFTTIRDLKTAKEIYEEEKNSTKQKDYHIVIFCMMINVKIMIKTEKLFTIIQ